MPSANEASCRVILSPSLCHSEAQAEESPLFAQDKLREESPLLMPFKTRSFVEPVLNETKGSG